MITSEVKLLPPRDRLLYWVRERESVRLKKESGTPPPWTDDLILRTYRFCNVRRMDDRVSRWLMENWYGPHPEHPNTVVAAALARHFNLPEALREIVGEVFTADGEPPRWGRIKRCVRDRKRRGFKVFNSAYMVRGIGTSDKTEMVVDRVCKPLGERPPGVDTSSMRKSVCSLLPYWGFSSFMAGQVVADLRWVLPGDWGDRHEWAPLGPGSARGLKRLYGGSVGAALPASELPGLLSRAVAELPKLVSAEISAGTEAMDYQNCLCEWDKYERALWGEGRPKRLYPV